MIPTPHVGRNIHDQASKIIAPRTWQVRLIWKRKLSLIIAGTSMPPQHDGTLMRHRSFRFDFGCRTKCETNSQRGQFSLLFLFFCCRSRPTDFCFLSLLSILFFEQCRTLIFHDSPVLRSRRLDMWSYLSKSLACIRVGCLRSSSFRLPFEWPCTSLLVWGFPVSCCLDILLMWRRMICASAIVSVQELWLKYEGDRKSVV